MARTDDDSWEITESVGATALGVAAARAADTESSDPLINDPFARVFLDRVGPGVWDWYGAPELPAEVVAAAPDMPQRMQALVNYFATRTKFFDTSFIDAANGGIRQAVILAAGLDARSWRLPWPDGTTVYELDQDRVLDFKLSTLHDHGAEPACNRVAVAVDLRQDWPTALQQAGFDPSAPSVWSIEGLLMYLPAAAQDLLLDRIQDLAAPGSRLAAEGLGPEFAAPERRALHRERMDRFRELTGDDGFAARGPHGRRAVVLRGTRRRRRLVAAPRLGRVRDAVRATDGQLWAPVPRGARRSLSDHLFVSAQRKPL